MIERNRDTNREKRYFESESEREREGRRVR